MVHPVSDALYLGKGEPSDICPLWDETPDQDIGPFVSTSLIGRISTKALSDYRKNGQGLI